MEDVSKIRKASIKQQQANGSWTYKKLETVSIFLMYARSKGKKNVR